MSPLQMDTKHKALIRKYRLYLSNQLLVDDTIVQLLYQEDILTESQVEEIQTQNTSKKRALRLLDILPTRGPRAFEVFLKSLEQEFPWVKEKILQDLTLEDSSEPLLKASDQWGVPDHILQKVPSDRQLNRLAGCLGQEWESVLLDLGLTPEELYRCHADHHLCMRSQVLAGLVLWKQSQGRRATVQRLLQSLEAAELHPSSLGDIFQ
ncbi:death domain-containing protein CRADD [Chanos chanos]|uniref:Death domain-containing protein CRADD n=1 Tax=Chanos chanos TaxID=29144 RepID=A0A6J2VQ19_CHACN|nr:death domain-containing protein CRADD-like [Chanos chanos]